MFKKTIFFICTLPLFLFLSAFAECQDTTSCNTKSDPLGYACYDKGTYSYECNVKNLCLGQRYG